MPADPAPSLGGSLTADPERFSETAWDLLLAKIGRAHV